MFDWMRMSNVQVGRDEARVSGHSVLFSVRCSKFVDIVSNNSNTGLSTQQQVSSNKTLATMTSQERAVI